MTPNFSFMTMLACAALLGACAATKPVPVAAPVVVAPPPVVVAPKVVDTGPFINEQLQFQAGLRQLSASEQGKLMADLLTRPATGKWQIRRAMLLLAMRGSGDLARAQALLDTLMQSDAADDKLLRPLAQVLTASIAEQRRQDDAQDKLATQLREAQRRNEQLNVKLEALKNIERSMTVRPGAVK